MHVVGIFVAVSHWGLLSGFVAGLVCHWVCLLLGLFVVGFFCRFLSLLSGWFVVGLVCHWVGLLVGLLLGLLVGLVVGLLGFSLGFAPFCPQTFCQSSINASPLANTDGVG